VSGDEYRKPAAARIVTGYLSAVSVATLCHAAWWTTAEIAQHHLGVTATQAMLKIFTAGWVWAFLFALIPFCIGLSLEFRFRIDKALFFITGGLLTGAVLVFPRVYFFAGGVFDQSDISFLERCWDALPRFAISGAAAGSVYYLTRRFRAVRDSRGHGTAISRSGLKNVGN
jgi:hypothetical protein